MAEETMSIVCYFSTFVFVVLPEQSHASPE